MDLNQRCDDAYGQGLSPTLFVSLMKEEISELQKLFRSANYNNNAIDLRSTLSHVKELTRTIRKDMAERANHNQGQEWVSSNSEQSRHSRRFRGAQLGLTQFE